MNSNFKIKRVLIQAILLIMVFIVAAGAGATDYGVILLDYSGSMTLTRDDGYSRFHYAWHRAVMRALQFNGQGYELAVVRFNGDIGFEVVQDFTPVLSDVVDVLNNMPEPSSGPMTPLADAMCFATQMLVDQPDGEELILMTLTDGDHNWRYDEPGGAVCQQCEDLYEGQHHWFGGCDPDDQDNHPCSDWQNCLVIVWAMNTIHYVDYFGEPTVKSGGDFMSDKAAMPEIEGGAHSSRANDYLLFEFLADFTDGDITMITDSMMSDVDNDSIEDVFDNCPDVYNPGQEDADSNGVGDACQCDCDPGNADGNDVINILDVTYLINYIYRGGPAPTPYAICAGDPSGNCVVNILDITHLINFLYKGGVPPTSCQDWVSSCGSPLRQ